MPFYYHYDPTYLLLIPAFLLSLFAQWYVNSTYKKYANVPTMGGRTAAQVARDILDQNGLSNVRIEQVRGHLTDHYDPKAHILRLSDGVYGSTNVSALGIAAHEAGHALQHGMGYGFLKLRNAFLPIVQIASYAAIPLLILGLLLEAFMLVDIAILLYVAVVVFYLITLPVEYNASSRAIAILDGGGYLDAGEMAGAKKVLHAAAFTYVANALMAILQLLRLVLIAGNRRRD